MIAAFLLAALAGTPPVAESKPREPRPLPDDRDELCSGSCYLLTDGCEGPCGLLAQRRERAAFAAKCKAERERAAAAKRLADTPAKTLRRRARGGDEEAAAELARRADSPAPVGADAGRDPGSSEE